MARAFPAVRMALAAIVIGALGACTTSVRNHGFTPSDEDLSTLQVGKDTRATVGNKVGRPSIGGLMADSGWYYVQSRWENRGPLAPSETDRQVLAISFDTQGRVEQIERFGLEQGRVVTLSRRVTDNGVTKSGFVAQMLGNVGRFNPNQFFGDTSQRGRL